MYPPRIPARLAPALAVLLVLAGATVPAHGYGLTTVVVSPVPGNPVASGTALLTALAGVTGTAADPYMLKVEPGVYDIGANRLQMKSWVDIEGSGIDITIIEGDGISNVSPLRNGVIKGADDCELRLLTVRVAGSFSLPIAVGIGNQGTDRQRFYRVRVEATDGTDNYGIYNSESDPRLEELEIFATGGATNYGIQSVGSNAGNGPTLLRSKVSATGGSTNNYALYSADERPFKAIVGNQLTAGGGATDYGALHASGSNSYLLRFSDNVIQVDAAENGTAYGIRSSVAMDLRVSETKVVATAVGGTAVGVYCTACGTVRTDHADIDAADGVVVGGPVEIGATRLDGASATGSSVVCAAVYDAAYTYYPGPTCP
jgi:hypothetical protein